MFDPYLFLSAEDMRLASSIICPGGHGRFSTLLPWRDPDLTIAPEGEPYLFRWYITPHNKQGGVYFHIQIDSDPERPLHDHPWDNMSVILAGGYDELWCEAPSGGWGMAHRTVGRSFRKGDVIFRDAEEAHRLILPNQFRYTMTMFSTGPDRRRWGFWFPDGWRDEREVIDTVDGVSVFKPRRDYDGN